jgi:flagellar hook-basal body complex protein FliE
MSVEEEIKKLTNKLVETANSSNIQNTNFSSRLEKSFGERIDNLTNSINESSVSSGKLTKSIINVTRVGVVVAILSFLLKLYELFHECFSL